MIKCDGVVLAINDRVGLPRPLSVPGMDEFQGVMADGTSDLLKGTDWTGKRVVVFGMGAFAVENVRTALEVHDAACRTPLAALYLPHSTCRTLPLPHSTCRTLLAALCLPPRTPPHSLHLLTTLLYHTAAPATPALPAAPAAPAALTRCGPPRYTSI